MKKASGDVIILQVKCAKNHDRMMYASWNTECERQNFLSFWAIFWPFTSLLTPKIKIWKKMQKRPGEITLWHMCTINEDHFGPLFALWLYKKTQKIKKHQEVLSFMIRWCTIPEIWCTTDRKMDRQTDGKSDI